MSTLDLAVDAVAAYRITRFVTADDLIDGPRTALVRRAYRRAGRPLDPRFTPAEVADVVSDDESAPKPALLITCRWCAGFWISAGVVLARRLAPQRWDPIARAFAFSAAAALLAGLEDS